MAMIAKIIVAQVLVVVMVKMGIGV